MTGLPEVESKAASTACPHCGGIGVVDSGGWTPWGAHIDIPCPSCHEQARNEMAAIGASWRQDSSLEKWFPITAEQLAAAELKVKEMEKLLRDGIAAADTSHTNPRRLFVWQDAAKAHLAELKR